MLPADDVVGTGVPLATMSHGGLGAAWWVPPHPASDSTTTADKPATRHVSLTSRESTQPELGRNPGGGSFQGLVVAIQYRRGH
jgi:hypothetical protein